jgi:RNA polymerase sigma-70 factor (ECF subfamily)
MKRATLLNIENLKLYLFISVRNASVKRLSQERKRGESYLDELAVEFISDYGNPEDSMMFSETEHKIKSAIQELPPRCQLIYKLAKEENMKYKEISQLLDLSVKTIDNQLAIAVKRIASVVRLEKERK